MTNRMNKLFALALAAVLASPVYAGGQKSVPTVNVGGNLSLPTGPINTGMGATLLPSVVVPTLNTPNVTVPNAAVPQQPSISKIGEAIAPQIEAIGQQNVSGETAASSGQAIERILQGGTASEAPKASFINGGEGGGASGLTPIRGDGSGASNNGGSNNNVPPAASPKAPAPKSVNTRSGYAWRRAALSAISGFWGMNFSLPPMGPSLTQKVLAEAAAKRVVFSDIDDTLGEYNKVGAVLSPEMAESVVKIVKAGKVFAAITDRGDFPNPKSSQKGAVESFATIPADQRKGIILATNGGGKVYEFDEAGEPKLIFEEPPIAEDIRAKIKESAEVVKAQLTALGTALQPHDPVNPDKPYTPEFHNPYGYGMILKAGTSEASVKAVAKAMQDAMAERGLEFEVEGRMAKDATLPPYITFSKINKTVAVKNIAKLKSVDFDEALAIGDSMYKPVDAPRGKHAAHMRKQGEKISGGAMPLTGNATDANMEKGLPGMLTISVGGSANPTMTNAWVMPGKGPALTKQVLDAVASKPAGPSKANTIVTAVLLMAMVGLSLNAYYLFYRSIAESASMIQGGPSIEDVFGR